MADFSLSLVAIFISRGKGGRILIDLCAVSLTISTPRTSLFLCDSKLVSISSETDCLRANFTFLMFLYHSAAFPSRKGRVATELHIKGSRWSSPGLLCQKTFGHQYCLPYRYTCRLGACFGKIRIFCKLSSCTYQNILSARLHIHLARAWYEKMTRRGVG